MKRCYCYDDGMQMMGRALREVLTEYSLIFRRTRKVRFLFWERDHTETEYVRIPKHYESDYNDKVHQFRKECIALIDQGYSNGDVDQELAETWRERIAEYQMRKGEVWE